MCFSTFEIAKGLSTKNPMRWLKPLETVLFSLSHLSLNEML